MRGGVGTSASSSSLPQEFLPLRYGPSTPPYPLSPPRTPCLSARASPAAMAECHSDVAAVPPLAPSFSTLLGQGHTPKLKSYMLSKHNKERVTSQPPPASPSAPLSRPMPPLEPLLDAPEAPGSSALGRAVPKKRPRLSSDLRDDPALLEAAASSPLYLPDTPFSLAARGDDGDAYLEGSRFLSPTPESTAAVAGARLQRQHDLDLASLLPLSPPSCHLSPGYTINQIFTELPFSPSSVAASSPRAVSQPPSPACVVPNSAKSPPQPQEIAAPATDPKVAAEDWLTQSSALDLSQLPRADHLPQLVIASHYRDLTSGLRFGQTPDAQMTGHPRAPAAGPARGGCVQMGGPQSSFQEVGQQRSGFQPVRPLKVRLQSGGPIRGGYPLVGPLRPVFQQAGAQGGVFLQRPATGLHEARQCLDVKPRPRPYLPRPVHLPRHFPPPLKALAGSATRPVPTEMAPHKAFPRDGQEPPSATNKQVPWLPRERHHENHSTTLTPLRSSFEKNNQQEKPIAEWTYEDVVFFIFKAQEDLNLDSKNLDVNFSELSGSTGEDLLNMDIEGFKRFSKGYGEQYYRYFIEMRDEERRLELQRHEEIQRREELRRQEEERRQSLVSSHQMLYKSHLFSPTSYEYLVSPSSQGQAAHLPSPSPREAPPTLIETQAPYEIRYEAPRSMAMENGHRSGISDSLPTASMKTFPLFSSTSPSNHYHSVADSLSDPDHSAAEEEEPKPEVPKKRGPGRPRKPENELKKKKKKTGRLWEFIRNLLLDPETCPSMVKWENPEEGIFRFVQAEKVAQKWGERKQNKDMNYEKLSRAMRYYYKGGVFEAVLGRRLVYKFGKNAKNWRPSNPNFANPPAM